MTIVDIKSKERNQKLKNMSGVTNRTKLRNIKFICGNETVIPASKNTRVLYYLKILLY